MSHRSLSLVQLGIATTVICAASGLWFGMRQSLTLEEKLQAYEKELRNPELNFRDGIPWGR